MYYFFFLPIGTDVSRRRTPVLTASLLVANLVLYVLVHHIEATRHWLWHLAVVPAAPRLWSALTACFIHAGWLHLGGNMLYLLLFGAPLEDRLGRWRFALIYLLAGCGALLMQALVIMWFTPQFGYYPIIGASGAVAGLLGAFMVRLPEGRIRVASIVMFLLHGVNRASIRTLNGVVAICAWMLLQLIYGLVSAGTGGGGVAYWAHLGGLALGAGMALALGGRRAGRADRAFARGERYMQEGAWFAAAGEYEAFLRDRPGEPSGHRSLARALIAAGSRRRALAAFRTAIEHYHAAGDIGEATATYREMDRLLPGVVLEPHVQREIVRELLGEGEYEAALAALEDCVRAYPDHPDSELLRLLAAEVQGTLLGSSVPAARIWRDIDQRRLPPRWRHHLRRRLHQLRTPPDRAA